MYVFEIVLELRIYALFAIRTFFCVFLVNVNHERKELASTINVKEICKLLEPSNKS